ncbi:FIG00388440: hypothetical protein [hydrothermal vent metagenome]|uniref:Uncharacterized protein n=1 Tax=hydrothermal vent metagenome TaxID=652676 RepID=A0A3B1E789_9ZZZZ
MAKIINEKTIRLQYIRVLEKFVKRTIILLKHHSFDHEIFKAKTLKNYEFVSKVQVVRLDSGYMKKLLAYTQTILNTLNSHNKTFKNEQQFLLKEANLLQKEKNKTNYKKDKHVKKRFNDGY